MPEEYDWISFSHLQCISNLWWDPRGFYVIKIKKHIYKNWEKEFKISCCDERKCILNSRAGHATSLPRQCDHVFRPQNFSLYCLFWLWLLDWDTETHLLCFFRVTEALIRCHILMLSLSQSQQIFRGPSSVKYYIKRWSEFCLFCMNKSQGWYGNSKPWKLKSAPRILVAIVLLIDVMLFFSSSACILYICE